MTPPPFNLDDLLTVKPLGGDQVSVTVVLPASLVKSYRLFLEALAGFFHSADHQSSVALAQVRSEKRSQEAADHREAHRKRCVHLFEAYTSSGYNRKEAIKRVASVLRAENHPWCSPDLVRIALIEAGRGGRPGRPRRQP